MAGRRRLGVEDVDRRAGDLARVQRLDQRGLVDQAAPAQLMIRTEGFIRASSAAPIRLRVSAVIGVCSVRKSQRGPDVVELLRRSRCPAPAPARRPGTGRSRRPSSRTPAPASPPPARPDPGRSRPASSPRAACPVNLFRSHLPAFRLSSALATFRARASIKAMVCSAVETVFPPGVFITTIPRRVAAATSMLSTPTPAAHDRLEPRLALEDLGGQLSSPTGSRSRRPPPAPAAGPARPCASLVSTTTSIPGSARSCASPSSASLSVTSTRCATIRDSHSPDEFRECRDDTDRPQTGSTRRSRDSPDGDSIFGVSSIRVIRVL